MHVRACAYTHIFPSLKVNCVKSLPPAYFIKSERSFVTAEQSLRAFDVNPRDENGTHTHDPGAMFTQSLVTFVTVHRQH